MTEATDPRNYDYAHPTSECDVVMKGGITSGVVYPHAICELARVYRLASIGGTSVGAVAAASAAAAEFGRGSGGFEKLARVPDWLGTDKNLQELFQPASGTRPAFEILMAGLGGGGARRLLRMAVAAIRAYPGPTVLGAMPGIAIIAIASAFSGDMALRVVTIVSGVAVALVGACATLAARLTGKATKELVANGFGLCSGMPVAPEGPTAITTWLSDRINDLAGRPGGPPLTFGDLQARGIDLAMMTTNITLRKAQRLPIVERLYFFDPDEWRRLFPENVIQWLIEHADSAVPGASEPSTHSARLRQAMLPRLPLPRPEDMPVLVAARMSLSFPVLISAVPLWAYDLSLDRNQPPKPDTPPGTILEPEQCWLSDGGISSNFPVHFFDAPLPTRPTFAIDLDAFHPDYPKSKDEAENVFLPPSNGSGLLGTWHRLSNSPGLPQFAGFVEGMLRTMQNRVDSLLTHQPGYRDRIVHVHTDSSEGGMNLNMPAPVIAALTLRGQAAAQKLVERFVETPGTAQAMSWDNHRWVRYRTTLAALGEAIEAFAAAWTGPPLTGDRTYSALFARSTTDGPNGYRFEPGSAQGKAAADFGRRLVEAGAALSNTPDLQIGAPRPLPRVRISPRD